MACENPLGVGKKCWLLEVVKMECWKAHWVDPQPGNRVRYRMTGGQFCGQMTGARIYRRLSSFLVREGVLFLAATWRLPVSEA